MPTPLAITADENLTVIRAAAPTYMKGFSDLTVRGHVLLALMKQHGMIEYGASDFARIWQMKVYEPEVRIGSDTTRKTFQNHQAYEQCQVDVRSLESSDLMTKHQYKRIGGERQKLISVYDQKSRDIGSSLMKRFQEWIYRDGDSATYLDSFQGFETVLADDGGTLVTETVAAPNDSYAGHATDIATFGGAWTADLATLPNAGLATDWPLGQGDSEYDAFRPVHWNWGSSAWTTAGSWQANAEEVLRMSAAVMKSRNGYMNVGGVPMVNLLSVDMYVDAENYYSDRFRIADNEFRMGDLGFPQKTLMFDGTVLMCDYACLAGIGYGICPTHMEFFSLATVTGVGEDNMIDVDGPSWSTEHQAWLYYASIDGNMRIQPKFITKYANYKDA